nr:RidA family protein [Mesorhizobium comanense]
MFQETPTSYSAGAPLIRLDAKASIHLLPQGEKGRTPPVDMVTGEMVRGDIEVQTEASLKALKHCLEAAGTSLDNVVMVRIYAVNSGFYNAINRVYARYFSVNPPARSFVPVASWPMEFDIEIECVAVG